MEFQLDVEMRYLFGFVWIVVQTIGLVHSQHEVCQSEDCRYYSKVYRANMNPNVDPCDNFYEYACGNFAKTHPIPDDQTEVTSFSLRNNMIFSELEEAIASQSRSGNKSNSQSLNNIIDLLVQCNQSDVLETRGVAPLLHEIEEAIGNWPMVRRNESKKIAHWSEMLAKYYGRFNLWPVFYLTTESFSMADNITLRIDMSEVAIPFSELKNGSRFDYTAYKSFIRKVGILFGAPDDDQLTKDVEDCVAFERELAEIYFNVDTSSLNEVKLKELSTDFIDWTKILNQIIDITGSSAHKFQDSDIVFAHSLKSVQAVYELLNRTPIERIQNAFGWYAALALGELTTEQLRELRFEFTDHFRDVKQKKMISHQQVCMQFVSLEYQFILSRIYIDHHFTPEDFEHTAILIKELKKSFSKMLQANDWMDDKSRTTALKKLASIKENIGYPEWLLNDTRLDEMHPLGKRLNVKKGKFLEAMLDLFSMKVGVRFDEFGHKRNAFGDTSSTSLEERVWRQIPPTLTNAAYVSQLNSIIITAAILKAPFFDKDRPLALNYGSLGMIIGHELTHGFDQSLDFNTVQSSIAFKELSRCFILQYNTTEPISGLPISGVRTLRENVADNGGIKESFNAYRSHQKLYGNSTLLPDLDLDADQLFFLGFANNWCSVYRPDRLKYMIALNSHSPEHFRANFPTANFEEFAKAFKCKVGTKQNPIKKCKLW